MFTSYLQTLSDWLESQNLLLQAHAYSLNPIDLKELSPDPFKLWHCFLTTGVVDPFYRSYFLQNTTAHWFSRQFISFSSFGFQTRVKKLLASLFLPYSAELLEKLTVFQLQMESWITGEKHRLILEDRQIAVKILKERYRFESDWDVASFLVSLGYHLPSSRYAFSAWRRFCGKSAGNESYQTWAETLGQVGKTPQLSFKLDRFLDLMFNPRSPLLPLPLCINQDSCRICPVSRNCHHFNNEIKASELTCSVNRIKCGNLQEITTEALLKFLLQEQWQGTDKQKQLLANYPHTSHKSFFHPDSDKDEKTIALLLALKELGKRIQSETEIELGMTISTAADIYHQLNYLFSETPQEAFYELILDNKNRILAHRLISLGTLNRSLVHPREVFAPAIQLRAAAVILVHNHPSGDPTPSPQDFAVTTRLKEVGEMVGINVLDHIIIGHSGYYSFVDHDQI